MVATPDPKPLPLKALQSLESKTPIEIWINGPEKEGLFNSWGIQSKNYGKREPLILISGIKKSFELITP